MKLFPQHTQDRSPDNYRACEEKRGEGSAEPNAALQAKVLLNHTELPTGRTELISRIGW
ncbi:MAG TPA: hypothetical protein VHW06_15990 [Streptosporangiaceae bacterium]|jgi:hypothetical protein|nr:hypothetical protein [Streptosporangiaceae bacterium]